MKIKLMLLALLVLGVGVSASAQEKEEKKPVEKMKLHLSGEMKDIPISELLKWWCEYEEVELLWQPNQVAQFKVSLMTSTSGTDIASDKFGQLVSDALEPFKLVVIEISANRYSIIQAVEAITQAPVLDVEAARKTEGWKWVTVRIPIRYGDSNAYRAALQNVMSRQGGSVNPVQQPGFLLACDRSDRLQRIIDTVEAMEAEGARRTAKTYELPAGIESGAVVSGFNVLVGDRYSVPAAATAGFSTIVVRATPEQIERCDELFKQIVANAAKMQRKLHSVHVPEGMDIEAVRKYTMDLFPGGPTISVHPNKKELIIRGTAAELEELNKAWEKLK